jgi:hypothetical protein
MKLIYTLIASLLLCCGALPEDPLTEFGQVEQDLTVELDASFNTLGQVSTSPWNRCKRNQSQSTQCRLNKPIQLPADTVQPGISVVRYQMAIPSGSSAPGWGADWRPTALSYANTLLANLQAHRTSEPIWSARTVPVTDPYNIYLARGSIAGTPPAGATIWSYFVQPSWSGCSTMTSDSGTMPGVYQACGSMTCLIDRADLFATHNLPSTATEQQQITYDANNLGQAIAYCIDLAIGIANANTAAKQLEPGRVQTTMELTQDSKNVLSKVTNPVYAEWGYISWTDWL